MHEKTKAKHDGRLYMVLTWLQDKGTMLNKAKCVLETLAVKFLGHIVDKEGIHPNISRVKAIKAIHQSHGVKELHWQVHTSLG